MTSSEAGGERRPLPYAALEPAWEEREFQRFRVACGPRQQQAPYGPYLFGRLLQEDLYQSCRPALPEGVDALHGVTIQGICILQVVDVANIGANFEHRTEHAAPGPTRTLKLGLTDGHQLVFGFEFCPLPQFSVGMTRGTKVVVENVPVRHGLLMLAPDNCELLGEASPPREARSGAQAMEQDAAKSGAYSTALVAPQFVASQQPQLSANPLSALEPNSFLATGEPASSSSMQPRMPPPRTRAAHGSASNTSVRDSSMSVSNREQAAPAVFVEIHSSDDDCSSDTTDPMVEHLFYSPKTPRLKDGANIAAPTSATSSGSTAGSRKRPRPASLDEHMLPAIETSVTPQGPQSSTLPTEAHGDHGGASDLSFSLLGGDNGGVSTASATVRPSLDLTRPFQYFSARSSSLSAVAAASTNHKLIVRACIKSVVGFQFNTGRYLLRVLVEDCTATREADVAESFVQRLMGVPCAEFLEAMKTKTATAHQWAARMQFALMNLEGVMTFQDTQARTSSGSRLTLLECRDFQPADTRKLLQRVKASSGHELR